jgi:hypothetical protein
MKDPVRPPAHGSFVRSVIASSAGSRHRIQPVNSKAVRPAMIAGTAAQPNKF